MAPKGSRAALRRREQAIVSIQRALDLLASSHPFPAAEAREALTQLMSPKKGRPFEGKAWVYADSRPVNEKVTEILSRRADDLAAARRQLLEYVDQLFRDDASATGRRPQPLTKEQRNRLKKLAQSHKPSEITREIQRFRFDLPDTKVRRLQSLITAPHLR